jgi:UDP-2,4-diacetamido-2,4,6-trideoxy-beta-L-altropyranose hydrolase
MLDEPLLIRADASAEIGTGHVMRCLALAQAWQAGGGSVYFIGEITGALESRLRDEGITLHALESTPGKKNDALETARKAQAVGAPWVVVDGYHFDGLYQRRLREEGVRVLLLDDYGHADHYDADLVLNQNIDAEATLYDSKSEHTELLLGPRYALLRKEFWSWREPRRTPQPKAGRVLVTLGGADPDNCTEMVVRALSRLNREDLRCTVVIGGSNPNERSIAAAAKRTDVSVGLRSDVSDMASLMAEHDVAVSAGGSTCWELAFLGVPNVILVLADNQRGIAEGLDEAGTAINLGWHESVEASAIRDHVESLLTHEKRRLRMAQAAQTLVDGKGAGRVLDKMQTKRPSHTSTVEQPSEPR